MTDIIMEISDAMARLKSRNIEPKAIVMSRNGFSRLYREVFMRNYIPSGDTVSDKIARLFGLPIYLAPMGIQFHIAHDCVDEWATNPYAGVPPSIGEMM